MNDYDVKYALHRCNSVTSVRQSVEEGFNSIEIDVRYDQHSRMLVATHDADNVIRAESIFNVVCTFSRLTPGSVIILDLKENGLVQHISKLVAEFPLIQFYIIDFNPIEIERYITACVEHHNLHLVFRQSEYEDYRTYLIGICVGHPQQQLTYSILLDSFENDPVGLLPDLSCIVPDLSLKMDTLFIIGPDIRGSNQFKRPIPESLLQRGNIVVISDSTELNLFGE